ncbi:MAG: response regulator [Desulfobacterales bacterium]|nr:response regulator [Desulfobacterales bacterium]
MEKKRALVIDDEQIVLDSVQKILSEEGYEVEVTLKGRTGIHMALTKTYDIVLTDIRMPDVGGMHVLRDIKRQKPSLPVLMITGYATIQSSVQAMKLGATDYLEKPFTPDQLIETVKTAIQTASSKPPEKQELIHKDSVLKVLERAAEDFEFAHNLLFNGTDVLKNYDLTGPEKLAIVTGDIQWIESQIGQLTSIQRKWLEHRLSTEIW